MENIIILILIVIYWFLLGSFLTVLSADTALAELSSESLGENYSIMTNFSALNVSVDASGTPSGAEVGNFFSRMLSLRAPTSNVPYWMQLIIAFTNYILIGVFLIVLIKQVSPFTK